MLKSNIHNVPFYRFSGLGSYYRLVHFISTRDGGVSEGEQSSLNIGFLPEDSPDNVLTNRELLLSGLNIPLETVVLGEQRHTTNIRIVTKEEMGRGAMDKESRLPETDALITAVPGICLVVLAADCVPVLLYDTEKRVIAAIHAGWKGTVGRIVEKVVERMNREFNCEAKDIRAGIGPAIGPCCYEVGKDVAMAVQNGIGDLGEFLEKVNESGKYIFNLWEANRQQLIHAGLHSGRIEMAGMCTCCHHDEFFSYRASRGNTGRFAAGIMIREK